MGIEREAINVSDLAITRPNRTGPGGDSVGADTSIGSGLEAAFSEESREFRDAEGEEKVSLGVFFIDPILDAAGDIVPVLVGDLATYTDHQGRSLVDQEIVSVKGVTDCTSRLDVVQFSIGRSSSPGG